MPAAVNELLRDEEWTRCYLSIMTRAARMPLEQLRRTNRFIWQLERDLLRSEHEGITHYERQLANWMATPPWAMLPIDEHRFATTHIPRPPDLTLRPPATSVSWFHQTASLQMTTPGYSPK